MGQWHIISKELIKSWKFLTETYSGILRIKFFFFGRYFSIKTQFQIQVNTIQTSKGLSGFNLWIKGIFLMNDY